MIPTEWCEILTTPAAPLDVLRIPQFWFTLVFLVLWLWRSRFPLIQQIHADGWLLPQVVVASLGLFFVAHAVAFKLHLPNRYTEHTFRIIAAVAAGLALVILWDTVTRVWLRQGRSRLATGSTLLLGLLLLLYPTNLRIDDAVFPVTGYGVGRTPALYEFLAQQPKDSLIASLSSETNKLPSFAKRSVLVGHEGYTLPYHQGYFRDMRQRTTDLMLAQYSPDPTVVKNLIRQYGIDIWLIEQTSFKPNYLDETEVFAQFPDVTQVVRSQLKLNRPPALFRMARTCTTFKVDQFRVLDAQCLLQWE